MKKGEIHENRYTRALIHPVPIKKSYEFYKHSGNLWNSKYLSSPKMSQYYLDPHENYITGPSSPGQLSAIESITRAREHEEKALKSRLESRQRLFSRKLERESVRFIKIQIKSRQRSWKAETQARARPISMGMPNDKASIFINKNRSSSIDQIQHGLDCFLDEMTPVFSKNSKQYLNVVQADPRADKKNKVSSVSPREALLYVGSSKKRSESRRKARQKFKIGTEKVQILLKELEEFEVKYSERIKDRQEAYLSLV